MAQVNNWKELKYKVVEDTNCWECISHKPDSYGYAIMRVNARRIKAHRYMYEKFVGPIPQGKIIRHICNNRICINPDHLLVGTQKENVHDAIIAGTHICTKWKS